MGSGSVGRTTRRAAVAALIVTAALTASCGGVGGGPRLPLTNCTVGGRAARCGTLEVAENRLTNRGRRISLRVVVVPATTAIREPDPIVYFAGGPGGSAIDTVETEATVAATLNLHRDLVFIDQRGTGGSHPLTCAAPPLPGVATESELTASVSSCLAGVQGDIRFYTTPMAADDVDQALGALGYGKVNITGGSYGATVAQVFLLRHPSRVRTATLSGGTLLDVPLYDRLAANSQHALENVFGRCLADRSCNSAFPNLPAEWARLRADLRQAPVVLPADKSPTKQTVTLDSQTLADQTHTLLLSADTASQLPYVIHALATATDRTSVLAALVAKLAGDQQTDGAWPAMRYNVRCNEAWARLRPDALPASDPSYYAATAELGARWWQQVCTAVPHSAVAAYGTPRRSETPVLILNGDSDPQDPPANMAGADRLWPNSRQLVEAGQSHGISNWSCRQSVITAFIQDGTTSRLDSTCLASVTLPAFMVSP